MKFVLTTLFLLTFCCAPVNGQQESGFKIVDPSTQVQQQVSGNSYYSANTKQPTVVEIAGRNVDKVAPPLPVVENVVPPKADARTKATSVVPRIAANIEPIRSSTSPLPRMPISTTQHYGAPVEMVTIRNHNLFGDPDAVCDEWENFCNCGGLKSNPGHLGRFWLRGGDQCEVNSRIKSRNRLRGGCGCNSCRETLRSRSECQTCND
jgi:hypothetical protein